MTAPGPESTIRNLFSVIDAGSWERLGDVIAVEAVYRRPGSEPMKGLARIAHFYEHERTIASGVHGITDVLVVDQQSACWGRLRGHLVDGRPVDLEFADVYRLVDSKIVERTSYFFTPLA
jgi:ketosteroid isomerase-like protein